jgi:hypothetical protein
VFSFSLIVVHFFPYTSLKRNYRGQLIPLTDPKKAETEVTLHIDSRPDFHDMAPKPKATINQETEISDNVPPIQRNITQKQQGQWQLLR